MSTTTTKKRKGNNDDGPAQADDKKSYEEMEAELLETKALLAQAREEWNLKRPWNVSRQAKPGPMKCRQ
jgi:uncharacterized protein involved in exopolysaccharide biosynthesis